MIMISQQEPSLKHLENCSTQRSHPIQKHAGREVAHWWKFVVPVLRDLRGFDNPLQLTVSYFNRNRRSDKCRAAFDCADVV